MTASYDFNHYLLAGHGRAYIIAKENPERYRDRIMSACRKDYAFDMQCEGSRAFHTYDLVSLFDDPEPFIAAAEESYADPETDENWNQLCHLTDLLLLLGQRETVIKKYKHLEKQLYSNAPLSGLFPLCESFEYLAISLVQKKNTKVLCKVMSDIGRWLLSRTEDPQELKHCFLWFDSVVEEEFGEDRYNKTLALGKDAEGVEEYIRIMSAPLVFERKEHLDKVTADIVLSWIREKPDISRLEMMARGLMRMDVSEAKKLAESFSTETDQDIKAGIASVFTSGKYRWPLDISLLTNCLESACKRLITQANAALTLLKDDRLHDYAKGLLEKGFNPDAIIILINNIKAEDGPFVMKYLEQLPVTNENEEGWHGIVSAIVHNGNDPDFPISLLYWAYEASLCSSCRGRIVKALMNRNHLPDQYREEMQWDANLDIRNMVGNK